MTEVKPKAKFTLVGHDDWSRELYASLKTGITYVQVDGQLHGRTDWGEPISPIGSWDDMEVVKAVKKWEIQTWTIGGGWINTSSDDNHETPLYFDTNDEAVHELENYMKELRQAVAAGDMEPYDPSDFRVHRVYVEIIDDTKS